jgi:hypothetical protein
MSGTRPGDHKPVGVGKRYVRGEDTPLTDPELHEDCWFQLVRAPGVRLTPLSRYLDIDHDECRRLLLIMERRGFLVGQDDRGFLFPFRRIERGD